MSAGGRQPRVKDAYRTSPEHRHNESLMPSEKLMKTASENTMTRSVISRMNNNDRVPNAGENVERRLRLKRELCCVEGCNRKHIMWTPKGKFCGKHRGEAIEAMRRAKVERFGRN